nr:MAG TPA: hypothetical protein [Caudoviricetes sp.]
MTNKYNRTMTKYRSFFEIGNINESGIARFKRVNSDK